MVVLAQGFRLQHALDLLVAMEAGHPEEDPARHMLKVLRASTPAPNTTSYILIIYKYVICILCISLVICII